jgi:hypothetical protein
MATSTSADVISMRIIFLLTIVTVVGGIVSGIAIFITTRLINLLTLNVILGALVGFFLLRWIIDYTKLRDRLIAITFAVLMGIIAYATYQAGEYIAFRLEFYNTIMASGDSVDRAFVDQYLDSFLLEETGSSGFVGYIKYALKYGFTITSTTNPIPRDVTGGGVLFYWGLDFAMLIGVLGLSAWLSTSRSFCENCQKFYGGFGGGWKVGEPLGSVPSKMSKEFLSKTKSGDVREVVALIEPKGSDGLELFVERCDTCDTSPIKLIGIQAGGILYNNARRVTLKHEISREQYNEIKTILQTK